MKVSLSLALSDDEKDHFASFWPYKAAKGHFEFSSFYFEFDYFV